MTARGGFRADVNLRTFRLSKDVCVPSVRVLVNTTNAPPGVVLSSAGLFETRIEAHQAAIFILSSIGFLDLLLTGAADAYNNAHKFILSGPNGEHLVAAQKREYAMWLYKLFAKFLGYEARVCVLLLFLYEFLSSEAPKLLSSSFNGYGCIFGVSTAFGQFLASAELALPALLLSPHAAAVSDVLRIQSSSVLHARQQAADGEARDAARVFAAKAAARLESAAAEKRNRELVEANKKSRFARSKALEVRLKARLEARQDARFIAHFGAAGCSTTAG